MTIFSYVRADVIAQEFPYSPFDTNGKNSRLFATSNNAIRGSFDVNHSYKFFFFAAASLRDHDNAQTINARAIHNQTKRLQQFDAQRNFQCVPVARRTCVRAVRTHFIVTGNLNERFPIMEKTNAFTQRNATRSHRSETVSNIPPHVTAETGGDSNHSYFQNHNFGGVTMQEIKQFDFKPIGQILNLTGHNNTKAAAAWIRNHNRRFPERAIIRRHGMVDVNSLKAALLKGSF